MLGMNLRPLACCVVLCSFAAPADADFLVKDGKPAGEFVVAVEGPQAEKFVTGDVRDWIEKITGARVPVVGEPSSASNVKIFVGTGFASGFPGDLEKLNGNDGFAVRRKNDSVYVFGSRPRGTLYGMYEFLQKNTDLICARPHDDFGTIFGESPNLELTETDFIDIPVFLNRRFGPGWPAHRGTGLWLLRNRDNTRDVRANYEGFKDLDKIEPFGTNFAGTIP